jgi:S-adenosylmethionine-diacylglycerol 3-amino-3-carboxypropyl transferase
MPLRDEAPLGEDSSKDRLLFAVIREDPRLEGDLVNRIGAKRVLCVASGGCVALSLASRFPTLEVTAFDQSRAQLDHLAEKAGAAGRRELTRLNVEDADAEGLNQRGELERAFRVLRKFFEEFIAPHGELLAFFTRSMPLHLLDTAVRRWTSSRYWAAAFHACFSDELLRTSMGPRLLRHAEAGSFPLYFQKAFERGLRRDAAPENPFLQHVFLGGYRRGCEPHYIRSGVRLAGEIGRRIKLVHGSLDSIADLETYDVVSLSNLFDGLDDDEVRVWTTLLAGRMKKGAALLVRHMNNNRSVRAHLEPRVTFDTQLGRSYFMRDRSLFYGFFDVGFVDAQGPTSSRILGVK